MASLEASVTCVEETLQQLSDEQLSGQLAVVKVSLSYFIVSVGKLELFQFTMVTLEKLEEEARALELRIAGEQGAAVDRQTLAASLTSCRTRLVTLNTQAQASKSRLESYMVERKKRVIEIKRYQSLLIDLEQWLGEAQSTISSEIRLTSAKVVRDQIRASEVR